MKYHCPTSNFFLLFLFIFIDQVFFLEAQLKVKYYYAGEVLEMILQCNCVGFLGASN